MSFLRSLLLNWMTSVVVVAALSREDEVNDLVMMSDDVNERGTVRSQNWHQTFTGHQNCLISNLTVQCAKHVLQTHRAAQVHE